MDFYEFLPTDLIVSPLGQGGWDLSEVCVVWYGASTEAVRPRLRNLVPDYTDREINPILPYPRGDTNESPVGRRWMGDLL